MNIGEWIGKRAWLNPQQPFLTENNKTYDNRKFNFRVNKTAQALGQLGLNKGDRVALVMHNSSEFLEIFFACAKTGLILVPINVRLAATEMAYILRDCVPSVVIYSPVFASRVSALKGLAGEIRLWYRGAGEEESNDPSFPGLVDTMTATEPLEILGVDLSDPLLIVYMSGTTGDPKGAVLTHQNILFDAIHSLLGYGIDRSCKSLLLAPMYYVGVLAASVTPVVYAGGSLVVSSFYSATETLKTIVRERINYLFAVPVMYQMMVDTPEWPKADLSAVRLFISGGAPIPLPVIRKYQEEKSVGFVQGYALSETGRLTSLHLDDAVRKAGSVGKEVFHVNLRIIDERGRDVTGTQPGEIIVQGPNVFPGYWNQLAATKTAFKDGWFYTGDMGRRDEEGFIYLVGRKVEMIISSGEHIYPAQVERALLAIPGVREAACVAIPDARRGEVVGAFLVLKPAARLSQGDVLKALTEMIAPYKFPRYVFFVDEFPKNQSGKVLKRELKKRAEESVAAS